MRFASCALILASAFGVQTCLAADTYKCKENGTTTFQDHPCKEAGGEIVEIKGAPAYKASTQGDPVERLVKVKFKLVEMDAEIRELQRGQAVEFEQFAQRQFGRDAPRQGSESSRKLDAEYQAANKKWGVRIDAAKKRRVDLVQEEAALRAELANERRNAQTAPRS